MVGLPLDESEGFAEESATQSLASNLQCRVSDLLVSKKNSDLVVQCKQLEWHVHKLVMCSHSTAIETACISHSKDAGPDRLDLGTENEWIVEATIRALYHGDYLVPEIFDRTVQPTPSNLQQPVSAKRGSLEEYVRHPLKFHTEVFAIAERLEIPWLKDLARVKFDHCLNPRLKPKKLADVVELVYSTTSEGDRDLRSIVVKAVAARSAELLMDTDFANMSKRVGDFAVDLALRLATRTRNGEARCGRCEHHSHSAEFCWKLHPELSPYRR